MGHERRAKDRKRLRRIYDQIKPTEDPVRETYEVMACECGTVWRYGRGVWTPISSGEDHTHVMKYRRAVA